MKKKIIKAIIFHVLLIGALIITAFLLIPSVDAKEERAIGFQRAENTNLDIVCLGNSDLYSGYIPSLMYEKYGYLSYNSGKSKVLPHKVLEYAEKLYKYQNPELLIVEIDFLTGKPKKEGKNVFKKVYENHDFWRQKPNQEILDLKGYVFSKDIVPLDKKNNEKLLKSHLGKINHKNFDIVLEIKSLCEKHNTKLMLLEMPSYTSWTDDLHNQVSSFAAENEIDFLDLNYNDDFVSQYSFDSQNDFRDGGNHLNVYGAIKATSYIGEYIQKYNITPNGQNKSFDKAVDLFYKKLNA
ncbi:MAG: hypothetical protein K6A63_04535 [Acholeplasmatales bacterium]|nr:hypothetical protein [Acholeplasmatales bacterium]